MKITAPNPEYSGTATFGDAAVLEFKDGEADYEGDELPYSVRLYLQEHGYGIGSKAPREVRHGELVVPADPREVGTNGDGIESVGAKLRDAAVDPRPEDFLPPINAGKEGDAGNPHGPFVVSPEIHAVGDQAVVPGPVGRFEKDEETGANVVVPDTDAQEARETEYAQRVLIGDEKVPDVLVDLGEKAGQPTPDKQLAEAAEWIAEQHAAAPEDGTPKGNASLEEWQEFARSKGAPDEDIDGLTRNELRDKYGPK